MPLASEQTVRR